MHPTRGDGRRIARVIAAGAGEALLVALALSSCVFAAFRWLPGDPARLVLGDEASDLAVSRLRAQLHLDEPMAAQYLRFLRGLVRLDLGDSFRRPGTGAMTEVLSALRPTVELSTLAVALGAALGVGIALAASGPWLGPRFRGGVDRFFVLVASVPLIALAPVLTWGLAARLRVVPLPGDPQAGIEGLLFASILLSLPLGAHVGRVARAALSEIGREAFLTVARAKGAPPTRVWLMHALPCVAGPIVTVVASQLGALLGGAVVLERLFERWGLGTLILQAYSSRDLPVLEGAVVAAGLLFVVAQTLGSALHAAVDPRVRSGVE
jgi:peptide/nickel transport system permease protein